MRAEQRFDALHVGAGVEAAAVLEDSPADRAVHQEDLGQGHFPEVEQVVDVVGQQPVPAAVIARLVDGSVHFHAVG